MRHAIWLGVLFALVGFFSYFAWFARFPSVRDHPWVNLALLAAGVALSAAGLWRAIRRPAGYRGRILGALGLALSLLATVLFCAFVFYFSYEVPTPTDTVPVGAIAPDFTLLNQHGQPVRLSDYRGRKVVLVFYRGYW